MMKKERLEHYNYMDSLMSEDERSKMEFARKFLMDELEVGSEDVQITLTNVHFKIMQYLIFSLILDYEDYKELHHIT